MAKPNATLVAQLNAYKALALFAAFHTADPGTTGASESTAGRVSVPWVTPTTGVMSGGSPAVPCTPGATYPYIGFWSALTGGTFVDGYLMAASVTPAAGTTSIATAITETQT